MMMMVVLVVVIILSHTLFSDSFDRSMYRFELVL